MRTKRIFIIFIAIGLLAALTTTVYAATSMYPSNPSLVGKWHVIIESESMPQAGETFQTYFADGNFVEFNALREAGNGVWIGSGNTYLVTFGGFAFDEQGNVIGHQRVRASIKMDGPDHFNAQWVYDTTDSAGKVSEVLDTGTLEGARMEVELP